MITLYGIPTCDTCRKARAWLDEQKVTYQWVDLRAHAPEPQRIERWVATLGSKALRNTSGASYRALGAAKDAMSDKDWTRAFCADPMLVKRPVLERDDVPVAVGFRAERYAETLGGT